MQYDRTAIAYHGCTAPVAEAVLAGTATLLPSENDNDWLGRGIYFWEYGPDRAWEWARERYTRLVKPPDAPFSDWYSQDARPGVGLRPNPPAVVGGVIQLGNCFDLCDTRFTDQLADLASLFVGFVRANNLPLPRNGGKDLGSRRFDCAVINFALKEIEEQQGIRYDTVRCAFVEGPRIYEDEDVRTELWRKTHIQIAVRNPQCILGTFRPAPR
jgi:hypothetical protein